jgi:hypothetical protein
MLLELKAKYPELRLDKKATEFLEPLNKYPCICNPMRIPSYCTICMLTLPFGAIVYSNKKSTLVDLASNFIAKNSKQYPFEMITPLHYICRYDLTNVPEELVQQIRSQSFFVCGGGPRKDCPPIEDLQTIDRTIRYTPETRIVSFQV